MRDTRAVFADKHRLDIARANAKQHLAFASGPRHCFGAFLARMEAEIGFTVLRERFGHVELAGRPGRRQTTVLGAGVPALATRPPVPA